MHRSLAGLGAACLILGTMAAAQAAEPSAPAPPADGRIGYGFASADVAAALEKIREPFNTSLVAQAAALASLADDEHRFRTRALVVEEREFLFRELIVRGLNPWPSVANFLLVEIPVPFSPIEPAFACRGVILRPMEGWGFPNAFRVSVGTRGENLRFLAALDDVRSEGLLRRPEAAAVATR